MSFADAVRSCLRNYVTFRGRAARPEFWYFALFVFLGSLLTGLLDVWIFGTGSMSHGPGQAEFRSTGGPLGAIFSLGTFLPSLAVGVRRLHDTGRSGWWLLLPLIPLIGALVLLYFFVQPSEPLSNAYGPRPGRRPGPPPDQPWGATPPPPPEAGDWQDSVIPKVPRND